MKMENRKWKVLALALAVIAALFALGAATVRNVPAVWLIDNPTITIAGATADTTATPSTFAHEAHIQWTFGTLTGTYSTCTAQAKTTYDGTNYLTLGTAEAITVTSGTTNAWDIIQVPPTTAAAPSVVLSAASATAALAFGQQTKFTLACASYGTSAPVSLTTIYR
jgi:hypothetical protein